MTKLSGSKSQKIKSAEFVQSDEDTSSLENEDHSQGWLVIWHV